jgi:hypothetical protein
LVTRLRFASPRELGFAALLALAAAIVLDRVGGARSGFCVGVLFGLGVGLGVMALGIWQRRSARG